MSTMTGSIEGKNYKTWIEDGILYSEFFGQITAETIIEQEKEVVRLIAEKNIHLIPIIITLKDIAPDQFSIGIGDIGKLFSTVDVLKYYSGVWVVGSKDSTNKIGELANNLFLKGKLKYVETLEQAQKEAKQSLESNESILT